MAYPDLMPWISRRRFNSGIATVITLAAAGFWGHSAAAQGKPGGTLIAAFPPIRLASIRRAVRAACRM